MSLAMSGPARGAFGTRAFTAFKNPLPANPNDVSGGGATQIVLVLILESTPGDAQWSSGVME